MSIAQFTPGATPNGDGQGGKMKDRFASLITRTTSIAGEDLGAARMAHAVIVEEMQTRLDHAEKALTITSLQLSRHQANEDRLLAWLDEYMHDHAMATNPDHDLAGAVLDVFRQQQYAIQLLREALDAQKAKTYRVLPPLDEEPEPAARKRKPGPKPITDAANEELRQAVLAHMRATARNGWAPTQREWNMDTSHNLPTYRAIAMRLGAWSTLIEQAGLRMVNAGMHAGSRPAVDEPTPEPTTTTATDPTTPPVPVALAAKAPAKAVTRQRTVLNARGEPEKLTTRRYLLSE